VHELSIAMELIGQIIEVAEANKLPRVAEVELETGILRQVIPEVMQTAFKEAARQTIASNAALIITEISAKARCNQCGLVFEPQVDDFLCPNCQIADTIVLQGDKIILKSINYNA
jgi:hydrogenase nickel incorporation protein HypA/HybF